jgi:hypothetical protein
MNFSPGPEFYAAAAEVIPLLLLALIFEARVLTRLRAVLPKAEDDTVDELTERATRATGTEMRRDVERWAGLGPHGWIVVVLVLAIALALGAEAVVLVALVLSDPPDVLAAVALAGCGILLAAVLATLGDVAVREMRRTPHDLRLPGLGRVGRRR